MYRIYSGFSSAARVFSAASISRFPVLKISKALIASSLLFGAASLSAAQPPSHLNKISKANELSQKYPELEWLKGEVVATQEGTSDKTRSISFALFGEQSPEFDRTMLSLFCLHLILDGSDSAYRDFTQFQKEEEKLSKNSFAKLNAQMNAFFKEKSSLFSRQELISFFESAIILADMGKSAEARKIFQKFHVNAPDHDDFYSQALHCLTQHPELCPSYDKLSREGKQMLQRAALHSMHYGHFSHLEGKLEMFQGIEQKKWSAKDKVDFILDYLLHRIDVMGALGQKNSFHSLVYTEKTHRVMEAVQQALSLFFEKGKTSRDVYECYLKERACWVNFDHETEEGRVLTRIAAMCRLMTPEEGCCLKAGIAKVDPQVKKHLFTYLDPYTPHLTKRTPTYIPAVFVNLFTNPSLGNSLEKRMSQGLSLSLPFLCEVFKKVEILEEGGNLKSEDPLCFNPVAKTAKEDPFALEKNSFFIHPVTKEVRVASFPKVSER